MFVGLDEICWVLDMAELRGEKRAESLNPPLSPAKETEAKKKKKKHELEMRH